MSYRGEMSAPGLRDVLLQVEEGPRQVVGTVVVAVALVYYGVTMFFFRVPFLDVYLLSDDWVPLIEHSGLASSIAKVKRVNGSEGIQFRGGGQLDVLAAVLAKWPPQTVLPKAA